MISWLRRRKEPEAIACQELVELVTAYLEGALSPEDHARFEHHISLCEACAMYLDQMRDTLEMLGELTTDSISREAEDELRAAFRGWKAGS